jgi:ABC-type transporter Mla MlaB component
LSQRIAIEGPMTIYEADDNKRELLGALAGSQGLELDLFHVDEFDTAGLQLLVLVQREGRKAAKSVQLVGASAAVLEVLERYGLATCFGGPAASPL